MFHILIGAVVGAAVGAVAAVVVAKVRGEPVTWKAVAGGAVAGLVGGAVTAATFGAGGAAAVGAGRAVTAFVAGGAAAGASGQATDNVLHDQPILQGVPEATVTGAVLGGATYGAGRALAPVARRVVGGIRGQPAAGASGSGAAAVTRSATPAAGGNAARAGPLAARPSLQGPMGDRVVSNLSAQPVARQPVASAAAAGRGSATTSAGNTATVAAERPATRGAVDALDDMMGGGRSAAVRRADRLAARTRLGGFKHAVGADEIANINRGFGGTMAFNGSVDSVLAGAARHNGFFNKAAYVVREIAGRHLFDNGNKRTAQAVYNLLRDRNGVVSGATNSQVRRVIGQVARGELVDIQDIARALRGF